jgi:hypothetical protein
VELLADALVTSLAATAASNVTTRHALALTAGTMFGRNASV